jgi:hypothetical protein
LLFVEESVANKDRENIFSTRFKERERSRGQYHNQSYQNQNPHQRQSHNSHNYQGNASTSKGKIRIPSQLFKGRSIEESRGRGRGRDGSRERYGWQCYYCNRFGYFEIDCKDKMHYLANKGANIVLEETRNKKLIISSLMAHTKENEAWYIDSGCSTHMTSQEELFTRIDGNYYDKVILGDDSVLEVKGKSTMAILALNGKKKFIDDTLLTPTLKKNLLFVGQMMEQNYKLVFDNKECLMCQ